MSTLKKHLLTAAIVGGLQAAMGEGIAGSRPRTATPLELAAAREREREGRLEREAAREQRVERGLRDGDMNPHGRAAQRRLRQRGLA